MTLAQGDQVKIIVQIPAYNEEEHLALAVAEIKKRSGLEDNRSLSGIIVINDGSTDRSKEIAGELDILKVVDLKYHRGLGAAFKEGLNAALGLNADVIVNFDADLQYDAGEIKKLITPILENKADMVIGDRQIAGLKGYPFYKFAGQTLGNFLISKLFRTEIKDATSGFRAFSRGCAGELAQGLSNPYTYTLESICVLLNKKRRIVFVPVRINYTVSRKSRLIKSRAYYVRNYLFTVLRCFLRK